MPQNNVPNMNVPYVSQDKTTINDQNIGWVNCTRNLGNLLSLFGL